MPDFNRVILCGRIGRDPELRYLPSNVAVVNFSIAVNESWKDNAGQKQERVNWIDIEAFARTAEVINQYLRKGAPILIEGKLRHETWQDKDGGNRSKLKVVVESFQFIDSKDQGGQSQQPPAHQRPPAKQPAPLTGDGAFQPVEDSSIPF